MRIFYRLKGWILKKWRKCTPFLIQSSENSPSLPISDNPWVPHKENNLPESVVSQHHFEIVETYPEFPGGPRVMFKYLSDNIKYPLQAREKGITGTVIIGFTLTKEGFVADVHVKSGIGGGCDEEARRVVASMPQWSPATQMGKNVAMQFTLPIIFKLG